MATVAEVLRRAEKLFASQEAVVCGSLRLDYAQFGSRCRRLAEGLRSRGVERGDRVGILMFNCHRYLEAHFAVPGMGAVLVPLNNRHALAEHSYIVQDAGIRVLITDSAHHATAEKLAAAVEGLVVVQDYEALLSDDDTVDLSTGVEESDLAGLFYTSGTTGVAKGVMLTHANHTANALHATLAFALGEHDSYLHAAPMFHLADGTCTYGVTWVGGRHVVIPRFEPQAVVDAVVTEGVTATVLVPTMIGSLVTHSTVSAANLSSLRLVIHGGAPMSPTLCHNAIQALGASFSQVYGMTEAAPLLTVNPREETLSADRIASVGREVLGVQVEVRRPEGRACDVGEIGEVVARGANIMAGYWNKPEETAAVLRDGWYRTGDLAYRDADQYLYIVDRAKDMIITGGENVYSVEVENALSAHPSVLESAVIGIPDVTWGERVHAVVSLKAGADGVLEEELREFCRQSIARYKVPASIEFVDDLPKSGSGKILKAVLREPHWSGREKAVN